MPPLYILFRLAGPSRHGGQSGEIIDETCPRVGSNQRPSDQKVQHVTTRLLPRLILIQGSQRELILNSLITPWFSRDIKLKFPNNAGLTNALWQPMKLVTTPCYYFRAQNSKSPITILSKVDPIIAIINHYLNSVPKWCSLYANTYN